jgi:hypothetical protein
MNFNRSFEFEVSPMLGKIDQKSRTRRVSFDPPSAAPFAAHSGVHVRSRSILIDAAACFVATALGSLSPQALSFFDFDSARPLASNVDPESGKFTDRVLIGGLRPISWEDSAKAPPPPAFTAVALRGGAETPADLPPKAGLAAAKPTKEATPKKLERAPEPKIADAAPAPLETAARPPAAAEPKSEGQSVSVSQGLLAALTPLSVSAKVAEKVWTGAKSVGGAVSGGLSWLGY